MIKNRKLSERDILKCELSQLITWLKIPQVQRSITGPFMAAKYIFSTLSPLALT